MQAGCQVSSVSGFQCPPRAELQGENHTPTGCTRRRVAPARPAEPGVEGRTRTPASAPKCPALPRFGHGDVPALDLPTRCPCGDRDVRSLGRNFDLTFMCSEGVVSRHPAVNDISGMQERRVYDRKWTYRNCLY